mmetsp:Transcript_68673/g.123751  ORF Transcript_68673/g.123751 Transcript_68673/m.123751 type:complete len:962 (+) Transcript_68673:88-2973(+)
MMPVGQVPLQRIATAWRRSGRLARLGPLQRGQDLNSAARKAVAARFASSKSGAERNNSSLASREHAQSSGDSFAENARRMQHAPGAGAAEGLEKVAAATPAKTGATRSNYEEWMVNLRGEDEWLASPRKADWFTGKAPVPGVCPGVSAVDGSIKPLPMPHLHKVTRKETQDYFDNSWTIVETLFAGFASEEAFYRPPVHGLRHPQIFYYGHTPCLYVNKLIVAGILKEPVDAYLESIFEVGVDEMLWDDMHKNDMVWPTVAEVREYRRKVYKVVSEVIANHPGLDDKGGESPVSVGWDHPMWALFMGFEHEAIHLETSSVLFRETPVHLMQVPQAWPKLHPTSERPKGNSHPQEVEDFPMNEMLPVAGCAVELGKPRDYPSYGWDNEYGHRKVQVPDFSASKYMITNGEFWHFISAGGYRTEKYWAEDAWAWRKYRNMKWPFFWEPDGPQGSMQFKLRTVFEVTNMQWDWPVDVNYHEAKAFCAWKSEQDSLVGKPEAYRVITEAEHHLIRDEKARSAHMASRPQDDRSLMVGGEEFAIPGSGAANSNLAYGSQSPVNALTPSPTGHHDAMGNAWEWTEDHFNPLEGYKVHEVYEDFSSPCFDGRHHIIMGGSFMSKGDAGASGFCRYHFRPHFLQHSGFRLVSSSSPAPATHLVSPDNASGDAEGEVTVDTATSKAAAGTGAAVAGAGGYETQSLVDQYLGFHFPAAGGNEASIEPVLNHPGAPHHALRFPQRVAEMLLKALGPRAKASPGQSPTRALDLGCAVGGSSFELAAGGFDEVVGIDFSAAFVAAAQRMQRGEVVGYQVPLEGELQAELLAIHEPQVDAGARAKVSFREGDACSLKKDELGMFDGAILANLLCRLPDPLACLDGLQALIKPGGAVVIVTPFSWLEDFTPRSKWLGGFVDPATNLPVNSKETLKLQMEKRGFVKTGEEQLPLVIREHRRKYQYIVSEATVWRRSE